MDKEKPIENQKIIKDALGRTLSRETDAVYFVQLQKPTDNLNTFFKEAEKEIAQKGFIKLLTKQPNSKQFFSKVKIKKKSHIACTSIPQHYAALNRVVTGTPDDTLSKHEWKTILYCGFSGVLNPSEDFIRFNDINGISFVGSEYKT